MNAVIYQEIIDEIGTQTLAKFGLNIFSLNSYAGYNASVDGAQNTFKAYDKHKNNPKYFGQTFEDLDVTQRNIESALHNEGSTYSTTDNLGEVNHPVTDVRKFDSDGNVVENYQHKVIKNSKDLFGKDNKYLQNDKIVVSSDDYERHKNYLENMIKNSKNPEDVKNAKELLKKLEKSDISREDATNARTTAVKIQSKQALLHIGQSGLSDATIVALSSLANGAIFEIKDAFSNSSNISTTDRISRLLTKVLDDFFKTFKRGSSFGAIDVAVGILSQIFTSKSSKIKAIWNSIRTSAKSIWNAIYSFITGEITSFQELISAIIKAILSSVVIVGSVVLEAELEAFLSQIVTPAVALVLAPALSIVVGSIAVVLLNKNIDSVLNAFFGVFAQRDLAKMRAEQIRDLCQEYLPSLIEERRELEELINRTYQERKLSFEKSFSDFQSGLALNDTDKIIDGLVAINGLYNKTLQYKTQKEFDDFMMSDESFEF